jgi:hypothetical protein
MRRNTPTRRALILICTVTTACIAAHPDVAVSDGPSRASPTAAGGAVVLETSPGRAAPALRHRRVFTCVTTNLVIFADRPCGPEPGLRDLVVVAPATAAAGQVARVTPEPATASTRPAAHPPVDVDRVTDDESAGDAGATCGRLEDAVRKLDDRMRTGYSAREAGRLWGRWREARARLREAEC